MTDGRRLVQVQQAIVHCTRCPRLRSYCEAVGQTKKAAYRDEPYWSKPVPGFGDPKARVMILGLAPAAHGANRTGRVFTGDGRGGSGNFLMAALHRAGFANQPTSERAGDGLVLTGVYVAAAVRCAPPQNKPTPGEIDACLDHLVAEVKALPRLEAVVALGHIAWAAWLRLLAREGTDLPRPRPSFAHGAVYSSTRGTLGTLGTLGTRLLVGCYHPSRQNTNTGRVTASMYDDVFRRI